MLKTLRSRFFVLCAILAVCSSFPVLADAPDTPAPREDGKMYFFDTAKNELSLIENVTGKTIENGTNVSAEVEGERSSFRLKKGQSQLFIIKLTGKVTPQDFLLTRFESKNGKRIVNLVQNGNVVVKPIPFTFERKKDVVAFLISKPLQPGEYSFSPNGSSAAFCFGVDE